MRFYIYLDIPLFYRSRVTDDGEVVGRGRKLYVLLCLDFRLSESALGCAEHSTSQFCFGFYLVHAKRLEGTGVGSFSLYGRPELDNSLPQSWLVSGKTH